METEAPAPGASEDTLVCVDHEDRVVGYRGKFECHTGDGILHRAFSVFLFDGRGETLLQQRAPGKRLWPGFWSNSCCSHPRRGERLEDAVSRRLGEELGIQAVVRELFVFEYHARYLDRGAEHERCWVFAGRIDRAPAPNDSEVAQWRFVAPDALDAEIAADPERFTPWLRLEWARIRAEHRDAVAAL
jgi:isopentenyl-diphosphate Delta-isomerase